MTIHCKVMLVCAMVCVSTTSGTAVAPASRKMKFGLSQGMVLAASGDQGPGVYLLEPDSGALPGMKVT